MNHLRKFKVANEFGTDLSSRRSGQNLRYAVTCDAPCVVDFNGVMSISDSFADEFFAVLVEDHGTEWFAANVKVSGLTAELREVVLRAVALRCEPVCS